jgi:alpha-L-fucosidase 2
MIVGMPALPKHWANGRFSGALARGAFELDYVWENGKLNRLVVRSKAGNPCRLKWAGGIQVSDDRNESITLTRGESHTWCFDSQVGKTYRVAFVD